MAHATTAGPVPGVIPESSVETAAYSKVTWRLLPFLFAC